jgi:hypothetical protein
VGAPGRDGDVFKQLGTREPVNPTEAQAVIENTRAVKGDFDESEAAHITKYGALALEVTLIDT